MPIKDLLTGRSVKIIGSGSVHGTFKVMYDDGKIKIRSRKMLELSEKSLKKTVQDSRNTV